MAIEICAVGGFSEIGKNMVAIRVGGEAVICDMGFYLPKILTYEEEEGEVNRSEISKETLIRVDAIPDDRVIADWRHQVKAIVLGHCHLDHIGAVAFMSDHYDCPIIGTPYTLEVLKTILQDDRMKIKNPLKPLNPGASIKVSKNITIEFINMTHSTPQTVMTVIHTSEGIVVYANDYKFDNHPVIGKKPDYDRLRQLGDTGDVKALIVESLYSDARMKTPSEKVAREMLGDVMLGTSNKGHLVVVTTFASHIARLKSIVEFGKRMKRKVVFVGRSLHKYIKAAENLKLVNFSKSAEIVYSPKEIKRKLKEIEANREKYLVICTGNQGEPKAVLTRIVMKDLPFEFIGGDIVIFSCRTIPAAINMANRAMLEDKLERKGIRLFKDIHVSGHAAREDHRDLIGMLRPKYIIPAHGDVSKLTPLADLASEMGYVLGKTALIVRDGQIVELD
ncbi:MAG TPA: RNase J family beta-CASP ribonuclease [Nanoarchaeota archaeon]|nr:RNase J family beta-CASP ribonuclease [Nanoarchaeota archaeon]